MEIGSTIGEIFSRYKNHLFGFLPKWVSRSAYASSELVFLSDNKARLNTLLLASIQNDMNDCVHTFLTFTATFRIYYISYFVYTIHYIVDTLMCAPYVSP